MTRPLTSWLALSAPLWRSAAEVVARWLADAFEIAARIGGGRGFDDETVGAAEIGEMLPVPAAGRAALGGAARSMGREADRGAAERREARRALRPLPAPLPALPAPGRPYKPALAHEVMPKACHECGKALKPGNRGSRGPRKFCSS